MIQFFKKLFGRQSQPTQPQQVFRASMPRTRVVALFIPKRDFEGFHPVDGSLLGHYKAGRHYYIREGNIMLEELCKQWESENLIFIKRGN